MFSLFGSSLFDVSRKDAERTQSSKISEAKGSTRQEDQLVRGRSVSGGVLFIVSCYLPLLFWKMNFVIFLGFLEKVIFLVFSSVKRPKKSDSSIYENFEVRGYDQRAGIYLFI